MQKIRFSKIVIGSNRIEIEKKKVNRMLSWPEPKNMKDVRKFLASPTIIKDLSKTLLK